MNNNSSEPIKPNGDINPFPRIIWLFCAFVPSALAIVSFKIKNPGQWLAPSLLILAVVCSFASALGLLSGMKDKIVRSILAVLLAIVFFILNVLIALFVGCSGMGRIAP